MITELYKKMQSLNVQIELVNGKLDIRAPKGALNEQLIKEISDSKEEIVSFIKAYQKKSNVHSIPKILVRPENIPLSFAQERLWFIHQLEGSVQYNMPIVLRLKGEVNQKALGYAFQSIVDRHEVLRTVFREKDGTAYQYIQPKEGWQFIEVDGSNYNEDAKSLQAFIHQFINEPFDLSKDYMLRAHLIKLDEHEYVLVVILHHIASDGWSLSILSKELIEFYSAYTEHHSSSLEPLEIQYADYALWQRNYLQGEILQQKLHYWKEKLSGVEALQMPTDYPRPAIQNNKGSLVTFNVDLALSEQVTMFSQQQGVTLFMTLMSAFKVLLYRYSGQSDICVGSPIAGRQQHELEPLIGFFVNTLALRDQLTGTMSFTELLEQVKQTTLDAYEHQEVPFEKVVEEVVRERDLSRNPMFQVMLVLRNTPDVRQLQLRGVQFSGETIVHNTSKFDLTFFVSETKKGLQGSVEFCTELYKEETIRRMVIHFQQLLLSIVQQPAQSIAALPLLTKVEEFQIFNHFNDTSVDYPSEKTIIDLFEEQVERTPHNIAVVLEENQLTYHQLNEKSNQLAQYLRSMGIKAESLVPICIDRSIEMIVGVLGILKAGGTYVPLDPEYPRQRIAYMLKDSGASVVVSSKKYISLFEDPTNPVEVVDLIEDWVTIARESALNPEKINNASHLTYVLYTSGSTGVPKGVKMPGSGLVNLLTWQQKQFENKNRRVLQFASLNFDVSFQDIFSTLCFGSSLYLISAERRYDMAEVLKDIKLYGITHLFVPYIVLKNLAEHINILRDETFSLEEIIVAGEQLKLTDDVLKLIKERRIRLINQYGPTEAHVVSSYIIDHADAGLSLLPPIGKPIDNIRLYILNEAKQLAPVGIPGEICIGGAGVARGYLNQEELTREKFIEDPFGEGKLYRTGDVGCWLPDGNIEYLGRRDDQVKIRGYRIELGEVESALQKSGLVTKCVVMARENKEGVKRLVAYVVPGATFTNDLMKSYLQSKLPEYMIPGQWVMLENLPLTTNGKVDKRSLPDVEITSAGQFVSARNAVEEMLVNVWQELLGVERISIYDNFFELGGHSLLAMRVISRIKKETGKSLPVGTLFEHQTIEKFAKLLIENNHSSKGRSLYTLNPKGSKIPLYIVCSIGASAFSFYKFASMLDKEQPVYVLQQPISYDKLDGIKKNIEDVASGYVAEIILHNPNGPFALSGYCVGGVIAFEMAKQLKALGKQVVFLAMFDTAIPKSAWFNSSANKKLYKLYSDINKFISSIYLKLDYNLYLLRFDRKLWILKKKNAIKRLINSVKEIYPPNPDDIEARFFKHKIAVANFIASKNYQMMPYDGEIFLFLAKKSSVYNKGLKPKDWKPFAKSIKTFKIEGEHGTIFDPPVHLDRFVNFLQGSLDDCNKG